MSITAYKIEVVGHDRTGEDYGYVNIMYRYGNKQSCPRPDQCEKIEVMWADESVYGPPAPGSKVGDFTAKHLGISNGYLCDIEQGRRPAPEGAFVERISSFLELDKQEHEMLLDLAADSRQTVPADLPDYIRQHDIVRAALRVAKEVDATDEEWKAFMEMLQNRQN